MHRILRADAHKVYKAVMAKKDQPSFTFFLPPLAWPEETESMFHIDRHAVRSREGSVGEEGRSTEPLSRSRAGPKKIKEIKKQIKEARKENPKIENLEGWGATRQTKAWKPSGVGRARGGAEGGFLKVRNRDRRLLFLTLAVRRNKGRSTTRS
ncbi:hypothetical protein IE53DRAFT_84440 [Violaceomyces palustris]|uniref:Uncharacterized protein n=1 Tax=Violaceomyces palustris TaxID=1673888 RepID=A0ACD0NXV2_9BASI|nr:hypothetical protein IE53DRAFT_84440 [Violaceomyces palustris]